MLPHALFCHSLHQIVNVVKEVCIMFFSVYPCLWIGCQEVHKYLSFREEVLIRRKKGPPGYSEIITCWFQPDAVQNLYHFTLC